jgi:hypothetical protein
MNAVIKIVALAAGLTATALGGRTPVKGFAVIELFTSEGCSSCPPADDLVARIQNEDKDQPVYILAYHVDYWDRQGWKDAYSSASYSSRQNQYATWLNLQSVYTPQIVVNGKKEFVGSEEAILRSSIKADLQEPAGAQLTISNVKTEKGQVSWQYRTQGAGKNTSLLLAVVQRSASTKVRAGENSGRTLSHVQIVRNFQVLAIGSNSSGDGSISLPEGVNAPDAEIIAFLQNKDNGQIIAATRSAL